MVKLYTKLEFVINNILHTNKQQLSHKSEQYYYKYKNNESVFW